MVAMKPLIGVAIGSIMVALSAGTATAQGQARDTTKLSDVVSAMSARGDAASPRTARLKIEIEGLPKGVPSKVIVTGPSTRAVVKRSRVLRLIPGQYRVRARPVQTTQGSSIWVPIRATPVVVKFLATHKSGNRKTVRVSYRPAG